MLGSTPSYARSVPFFMGWDGEAAVRKTSHGWDHDDFRGALIAENIFN